MSYLQNQIGYYSRSVWYLGVFIDGNFDLTLSVSDLLNGLNFNLLFFSLKRIADIGI